MLDVSGLHAYYGKSHVLHGVDLVVNPGEIVSLLGRNGVGRSTTIKAIMGLVNSTGSIHFDSHDLKGLRTYQIALRGLAYVPESRDVFPALTVEQNLLLGQQRGKQSQWSFEDMYELFPRLKERRHTPAGVMSGGEQQMLTLCRSLMGNPRLIMIDEPTEGLAPRIVDLVAQYLDTLRQRGVAVLLVEQKLAIALDISQRLYVMGRGTIVFEGTPDDLRQDQQVRRNWLEV
ncbi:ABC transporter ATP-binding protein [Castellaniella sp.]|uniref:ABC transporter ATP-binding protein n=1 Tax=Castellaniella sp. TaxID=1955812 RepID=UPI00355EBC1B